MPHWQVKQRPEGASVRRFVHPTSHQFKFLVVSSSRAWQHQWAPSQLASRLYWDWAVAATLSAQSQPKLSSCRSRSQRSQLQTARNFDLESVHWTALLDEQWTTYKGIDARWQLFFKPNLDTLLILLKTPSNFKDWQFWGYQLRALKRGSTYNRIFARWQLFFKPNLDIVLIIKANLQF